MDRDPHHPHAARPDSAATEAHGPFEHLVEVVMAQADRLGHREHIHLTWLAIRAHGVEGAIAMVSGGLRRTARYAGAPRKYNATLSRAWVELVAHHMGDEDDFAGFLERHPRLLDKRLIARHYRARTLAGTPARTGWVAPDLAPFPWQARERSAVRAVDVPPPGDR